MDSVYKLFKIIKNGHTSILAENPEVDDAPAAYIHSVFLTGRVVGEYDATSFPTSPTTLPPSPRIHLVIMPATKLPAELEQTIFEMVARNDLKTAPRLLLVARRVHIWIEPLMYETLQFDPLTAPLCNKILRALETKSPDFRRAVKNVFLVGGDLDYSTQILHLCHGATNITSCIALPSITLSSPYLRRLSIKASRMVPRHAFFTFPSSMRITHLELFDDLPITSGLEESLGSIATLTHLALNVDAERTDVVPVVKQYYGRCKSLEILVLCLHGSAFDNLPVFEKFAEGAVVMWEGQSINADLRDFMRGDDLWRKVAQAKLLQSS